jgi:hypothetical protein
MIDAEIQVAAYFDVYFVDAESKEEAQDLHEKLIKSLRGGKYFLPMLSNIHKCDYSNADIKLDVGKVILHDDCYMSVVEINIINKTKVDFEPYADVDDWFYDIDTCSEIESETYITVPYGLDVDFYDIGADVFEL